MPAAAASAGLRIGGRPIVIAPHNCFACGTLNAHGLHLGLHAGDDRAGRELTLPDRFEGWEGIAHGGILPRSSTRSWPGRSIEHDAWGVTARMSVEFRRPVPIGARDPRGGPRRASPPATLRTPRAGSLDAATTGSWRRRSGVVRRRAGGPQGRAQGAAIGFELGRPRDGVAASTARRGASTSTSYRRRLPRPGPGRSGRRRAPATRTRERPRRRAATGRGGARALARRRPDPDPDAFVAASSARACRGLADPEYLEGQRRSLPASARSSASARRSSVPWTGACAPGRAGDRPAIRSVARRPPAPRGRSSSSAGSRSPSSNGRSSATRSAPGSSSGAAARTRPATGSPSTRLAHVRSGAGSLPSRTAGPSSNSSSTPRRAGSGASSARRSPRSRSSTGAPVATPDVAARGLADPRRPDGRRRAGRPEGARLGAALAHARRSRRDRPVPRDRGRPRHRQPGRPSGVGHPRRAAEAARPPSPPTLRDRSRGHPQAARALPRRRGPRRPPPGSPGLDVADRAPADRPIVPRP